MPQDLTLIPKFRDRLSYLYVEHALVERDQNSIVLYRQDPETQEEDETPAPVCDIALLMLGPGTKLTHRAMEILARNNCLVAWVGEEGVRLYAFATGGTHSSERLLRQARMVTDPYKRLEIVRRLYAKRFPEALDPNVTIEQLRGKEGHRVRQAYAAQAAKHSVDWQGRNYDRNKWQGSDPVNTALSAANACLYGICHAACLSMGFSPALGFIHTGKQLSFVYDLADLYKLELSVPISFAAAAQESEIPIERRVRLALRDVFREFRFLERVSSDLMDLFGPDESDELYDDDPARPGELVGGVEGGVSYEAESE
ncbi:MAG TPA: type I-E CRISPR-associated endonuclease Cas1e [Fimbriimonadaceae bacterium]|nr:type I-E CRISPR-associated endonuclease Cas1e [Fimbriimonadaceae bacterium]